LPDIAPAPGGLLDIILSAKKRATISDRKDPLVELDTESAVALARTYLTERAPLAVQGEGGNDTTYRVACHVRDLGVSKGVALDLMLDHWNDRCEPPWDATELADGPVGNAYRYGQNAPGAGRAAADFEAVEIEEPKPSEPAGKKPDLIPGRISFADLADVPPRRWLYGNKLLAKYTAFCASPGGVGKTSWALGVALACASGRKLLHDQPHHPMNVWYYNLEDDLDEMKRRLYAAAKFHDIPAETASRIRLNSGRDRGLKVLALRDDQFVVTPDTRLLTQVLLDERIELLIVDPFLRSHAVKENDNEAQDEVMRVYAAIADKTDSAILLLHHMKKGGISGDADSLRGGSTQGGGARTVLTMAAMSEEEARAVGVDPRRRRTLIRIDDPKRNMSPPAVSAEWIRLHSVRLGNATEDYPDGDEVQAASSWSPPKVSDGLDENLVGEVLSVIDAGTDDGERFSARAQDKGRWAGTVIVDMLHKSENEAGALLKEWIDSGLLEVRPYKSPTQRKTRQGLFGRETDNG
jgi:hypothetical protein